MVPFGRPDRGGPGGERAHEPSTFDFLGFTHYWGKSRKGYWTIRRKTAAKRLRRTLRAIGDWCQQNRHRGMWDQFKVLLRKLEGLYAEPAEGRFRARGKSVSRNLATINGPTGSLICRGTQKRVQLFSKV